MFLGGATMSSAGILTHGGFCRGTSTRGSHLFLSGLSVSSSLPGRSGTSNDQPTACGRGRATAPAFGRFLRAAKRARRPLRTGTHLGHRSQYHRQGSPRTRWADARAGGTKPAVGSRSQTSGSQSPGVVRALLTLLQDATAGDPITGLKWTHRSLRKICKALARRKIKVSPHTVARLLRMNRFSLRTCRKQRAGLHHAERDRQFRYLTRLRRLYISRGWPVISVDTKKKERVGDFKNAGHCWRRQAREVLDHDFPTWSKDRAIPVGAFDVAHNDGLVVVGTSHETPAFVGMVIGQWWRLIGRKRYGACRRLLIQSDSGGANDHRKWEWKIALQALADEFDLTIAMTHYPSGASKWNPIDPIVERISLPRSARPHGIQKPAAHRRAKADGPPETAYRVPAMELCDQAA